MIDPAILYAVLRKVAGDEAIISYQELARLFHEAGGDWFDPGPSLDLALANLDGLLRLRGLSPLSCLVTSAPKSGDNFEPPVHSFWGSPGVPARPARSGDRLMIWMGFVNLAYRAKWPESLTGS